MGKSIWVVEEQKNKLELRKPNSHGERLSWKAVAGFSDHKEAYKYMREHPRPWAVKLELYSPHSFKDYESSKYI